MEFFCVILQEINDTMMFFASELFEGAWEDEKKADRRRYYHQWQKTSRCPPLSSHTHVIGNSKMEGKKEGWVLRSVTWHLQVHPCLFKNLTFFLHVTLWKVLESPPHTHTSTRARAPVWIFVYIFFYGGSPELHRCSIKYDVHIFYFTNTGGVHMWLRLFIGFDYI